ncbi:universal stress protein [Streptomyces sp. AF1A]|uniref:universal stress protein n=1 Tax=Streptomyces sp. AF1A TaxID=3394350 RepID=UPI0039BC9251
MHRTVTAGLDGSPESRAAAEWAAREARLRGLPLRIVHVGEPLPGGETSREGAERIVDASREASLLVVGRRTRTSPLGTHVGHVAHAVLHHAPAPVAVVPHD